jgi:dihydrofolate reductase
MSKRRIVTFNHVSADGYFTDPDGGLSWVVPDPELDRSVGESIAKGGRGAFLFGRRTYEQFASFWPKALETPGGPDDPHHPGRKSASMKAMAESLNAGEKLVLSRTMKDAPWKNTRILGEFQASSIEAIKRGAGPDILVFGSGTIVSLLTKHQLVDEYRFVVAPVALGGGRTLLQGVGAKVKLELKEAKATAAGNVLLTYVNPTSR